MKRIIAAVIVIASAFALSAAEGKKLSREEEAYRQTGGRVLDVRKMKGRIVYVNAQKRADAALLRESAEYFSSNLRVKVDVEDGKFDFPAVKPVGEATVFVVDIPGYPSVLAAPDNAWAAVNVAALIEGRGQNPAFFRARVKKELTRALAAAIGGIDSAYPNNPVGPVAKVDDLDRMEDYRLAVDVMRRMEKALKHRGVVQYSISTYEQACMEGWAHKPTNAVEKAIWDDVHALPSKPLAIKPESKR